MSASYLPADAGGRLAPDLLEGGDHLGDAHRHAGNVHRTGAPSAILVRSSPRTRSATTVRGDASQMRVAGATGQIASTPASGSRMMLLANEDAALLGFPGARSPSEP